MTFLLRYWPHLLSAIALLAIIAAIWAHFAKDARTERKLAVMTEWAGVVILRTREASDNSKVTSETTPGQIVALGESNKRLKGAIAEQTAAVDAWAREAADRKAEAAEWRAIADKAEAQRASVLRRLGNAAATPGTRADCMKLLQEAEDALDLARKEGGV